MLSHILGRMNNFLGISKQRYETEDRALKRDLFGSHHQSVNLRANKIIQRESVTTWAEVQYYSGEHQLIKGKKVQRNII